MSRLTHYEGGCLEALGAAGGVAERFNEEEMLERAAVLGVVGEMDRGGAAVGDSVHELGDRISLRKRSLQALEITADDIVATVPAEPLPAIRHREDAVGGARLGDALDDAAILVDGSLEECRVQRVGRVGKRTLDSHSTLFVLKLLRRETLEPVRLRRLDEVLLGS